MKNAKKITSILMAVTITMAMLVGCSTKKADSTSSTATSTTSTTTANANKGDQATMKTLYSNVLKALVTNKTITQIQSDKVLAVVVKATQTNSEKPSGTPPTDNQKPSGEAPKDGEKPSGTAPTGGSNSKDDKLSALVTSKVITQVQADTIKKNVQAAMKSSGSTKAN